ncbi:MAG: cob(I)yrinic acid a,c-diamide adenosyltransferase [Candidatus Bathyarchaeota archaeon]
MVEGKLFKFSKAGDHGYTSLLDGKRVPKYDERVEAYGTIDEAVSVLGLAKALSKNGEVVETILKIQKTLYDICSELSTPLEAYDKAPFKLTRRHVEEVEEILEKLLEKVEIGKHFVIPGKNPVSATLDFARTIVRRAERKVHKLIHDGKVKNLELGCYLNRVADLLFTLARLEEKE